MKLKTRQNHLVLTGARRCVCPTRIDAIYLFVTIATVAFIAAVFKKLTLSESIMWLMVAPYTTVTGKSG